MDFVGRDGELAVLDRAWSSRGGALVPVYGRRRVGKSELLVRFLASRPGVYFVGKQAPAPQQIREFLQAAALALGEPLLGGLEVGGWKEALEAVVGRWSGRGKLVVALDEFQWIVAASPELPSVLQALWDRLWKDGRVMLVLCGSFVGFMERDVLGRKSPLFGRRTAQIHLQPFDFRTARRFHPGWSLADAARAWFVCGGIPQYLKAFDPGRSIEQNLRDTLFDEFAPLYREPEFLLREELREVQNYFGILVLLATGSLPTAELARRTAIPLRSLPYYLQQLVELRYVRKRHPLDGRPAGRRVRYVLEDPLLRFWFRFVWPNTSFIARMGPERAFADLVRPELDAYFGTCFEALCREALPFLYEREGVRAAFEVGEYWAPDLQIDAVGLRDDARTDLAECRWGTVRSPGAVVRELREKAGRFPNPRGATLQLRVVTRAAPARAPEDVRWHDLRDLYDEPATRR